MTAKETYRSEEAKMIRAKKNILWFGIISLAMSFAGLTSAYVVSRERSDWLSDFDLPQAYTISLILILISSVTMHLAKVAVKKEQNSKGMLLLVTTFLLGIAFVYFQFVGFSQIIQSGYYFTGETSSVTTTYIYLMVVLHIAHVIGGLISLLVVIYNHYKQKYRGGKTLGIEQAATFWHFIDVIWIYLFLFLYFVK